MPRGATSPTSGRHPFFWVAAAAAPLCAVIYVSSAVAIWRYGNYAQSFGWTAAATRNSVIVASVERGGAADGTLQPGDVITGVSSGVIPPIGYYRRAAPVDHPYSIHIASPRSTEVTLTAPIVRVARLGRLTMLFLSAVTFVAVGLFFGLVRPDLPTGRLICLAAVGTGFTQLFSTLDSFSDQLPWTARLVNGGLSLFVGIANAALFHATVRLPGPSAPRVLSAGLGTTLYALAAATFATFAFPGAMLWWSDVDVASRILFGSTSWFAAGPILRTVTELLTSVGILAVVGWKLAFVRDPDEQRRLRWLFAGIIIATIPFATYKILQVTLVSADPAALRDSSLRTISAGAIASVPLTLAYAVAKHRILDITVVVRRGLQYLLARNALTFVLLLPAAGLVYTVVVNQDRTIKEALFENPTYLALMGAALLALKFRRAVRERLDRIFFREAYDRERVLIALLDEMDRLDSIAEVAALVAAELERTLHPRHVYVWVRERETREFTLAHSSSPHVKRVIPEDSRLLADLQQNPRAHEWLRSDNESDVDHVWLDGLGVELVVPVVGTDRRLTGVLMLGAKKSEEPYSARDRELLEAIAKQLAVVRENVRLHERIHEERQIRDQVIDRLERRAINLVKECPGCGACYDSDVAICTADGIDLRISVPVDRLVDGQYRLDRLIGKGGMGAVYEAEDMRLQRKVAIKFLIGRALGEQTALRRFEREAQLCARLSHPNIVTVFDYGTLPASGAYLVMERLHGVTLRDTLTRTGPLQPAAATAVFEQIVEGVKAAHAHGIVHRDLKPENVLMTDASTGSPRVKLLDFGLAQLRALDTAVTATVTAAGVMLGTLGYMAPEQFVGVRVDERADIFAFGVMLAEALTGKRPFDRPTYAQVLSSIHLEEFHLPGSAPAVGALDGLLQQCLAKDPAARFESAVELQRHLIPALRACPPNSISGRGV